MHKLLSSLTIILLLSGCTTTQMQFTENNHTDSVVDANILVITPQKQIVGTVPGTQSNQTAYNTAQDQAGLFGIFLVGMFDAIETSNDTKRMYKLVEPVNNKVSDLDFKKDLVRKLQEKCIFTSPERITVSEEVPEYEADLLRILKKLDDKPTIIISSQYSFDPTYRVFMIDTALSLWLNKTGKPAYTTSTSYYSHPITPFVKKYSHTLGDVLLLQVKEKSEENIYAPNISLWSHNRAQTYRQYYAEGIEESANMIVNALTKKLDLESLTENKLATYINYHIPQFNKHGFQINNTSEGRVIQKAGNRTLLVSRNGSFSSIYSGPVLKRLKKSRTFKQYR
ncbi:MAG: hypothetical protein JAY66_15050 [Candidatus Thiodiazotropha taylori]|nr:hypothetical protein [Candidatus Thiodiazotropha taylori]